MKVRELAARYGIEIGCLDNSCRFGSPGGMGTNGGCRCLAGRDRLGENAEIVRKMISLLQKVADDASSEP